MSESSKATIDLINGDPTSSACNDGDNQVTVKHFTTGINTKVDKRIYICDECGTEFK